MPTAETQAEASWGVVWVWAQRGDAGREMVGSEQAGGRPGVSSCTVTLIVCSAFTRASVRNAGRAFLWEELRGLVVQLPPPPPRVPASGELEPGVLAWGQKGQGVCQGRWGPGGGRWVTGAIGDGKQIRVSVHTREP